MDDAFWWLELIDLNDETDRGNGLVLRLFWGLRMQMVMKFIDLQLSVVFYVKELVG